VRITILQAPGNRLENFTRVTIASRQDVHAFVFAIASWKVSSTVKYIRYTRLYSPIELTEMAEIILSIRGQVDLSNGNIACPCLVERNASLVIFHLATKHLIACSFASLVHSLVRVHRYASPRITKATAAD